LKNLQKYRQFAGITQKQMADELAVAGLKIDPTMISHYERGIYSPSTKKALAICAVLKSHNVDVTIEMLEA
jgi:transcriptional regulator with XRE-family HTH domain